MVLVVSRVFVLYQLHSKTVGLYMKTVIMLKLLILVKEYHVKCTRNIWLKTFMKNLASQNFLELFILGKMRLSRIFFLWKTNYIQSWSIFLTRKGFYWYHFYILNHFRPLIINPSFIVFPIQNYNQIILHFDSFPKVRKKSLQFFSIIEKIVCDSF